jgi:hypothetical protein
MSASWLLSQSTPGVSDQCGSGRHRQSTAAKRLRRERGRTREQERRRRIEFDHPKRSSPTQFREVSKRRRDLARTIFPSAGRRRRWPIQYRASTDASTRWCRRQGCSGLRSRWASLPLEQGVGTRASDCEARIEVRVFPRPFIYTFVDEVFSKAPRSSVTRELLDPVSPQMTMPLSDLIVSAVLQEEVFSRERTREAGYCVGGRGEFELVPWRTTG